MTMLSLLASALLINFSSSTLVRSSNSLVNQLILIRQVLMNCSSCFKIACSNVLFIWVVKFWIPINSRFICCSLCSVSPYIGILWNIAIIYGSYYQIQNISISFTAPIRPCLFFILVAVILALLFIVFYGINQVRCYHFTK